MTWVSACKVCNKAIQVNVNVTIDCEVCETRISLICHGRTQICFLQTESGELPFTFTAGYWNWRKGYQMVLDGLGAVCSVFRGILISEPSD